MLSNKTKFFLLFTIIDVFVEVESGVILYPITTIILGMSFSISDLTLFFSFKVIVQLSIKL
jgi:hypothetical protein